MPPTTRKFVHRRSARILPPPARFLLLGLAGLWIGCAGRAHGQANAAPDVDPGKLREERRAAPEFRTTPWRSLEAMLEEARIKNRVTLTPQELLQEQKKRLELPAETKVAVAESSLPMNAANKIWETPPENSSGSALGLVLTLGAALAALIAAWKAGWFRRKIEKSVF